MAKQSRRERIKAVLRTQYGSLRGFEDVRHLPRDSVRDVLRGRASKETQIAIAEAMGEPVQKLFPDRNHAVPDAGESSTNRDNTRTSAQAHRLSREAV